MGTAEKGAYVRRMFSAIAPRYDLLNRVLSFSLDRIVAETRASRALRVEERPAGSYLDLCAGTLDVAAAIARLPGFTGPVVGADFAEAMLREGGTKRHAPRVAAVTADALCLPLRERHPVRGRSSRSASATLPTSISRIHEVHRVLEPGARFVILEFTTPRNRLVRAAYHAYFHHVLPRDRARWSAGIAQPTRTFPRASRISRTRWHLARGSRRPGFTTCRGVR